MMQYTGDETKDTLQYLLSYLEEHKKKIKALEEKVESLEEWKYLS